MRAVRAITLMAALCAAPAAAQDEASSAGEVAEPVEEVMPDESTPADAAPATDTAPGTDTAPDTAAGTDTAPPPERAAPISPPRAAAPLTSSGPPAAPRQPQPRVVIVRQDAAEDEEEPPADEGDPYDILWVELFGGASYVDLRAIEGSDYLPEIVRVAGWGPAGGVAAGFRVEFFSAGVRAALARYDASSATAPSAVFDVGTLAAEVKLALPIPVVQPFLRVGFGMGWHGNSNIQDAWTTGSPPSDMQTTVFGWVFQAAVGVDIYLVHWFAIGAAFSIDLLNMSRQAIEGATDVTLRDPGDAIGVQARGQGAISFHF